MIADPIIGSIKMAGHDNSHPSASMTPTSDGNAWSQQAARLDEMLTKLVEAQSVWPRAHMTARGDSYSKTAVSESQRARLLMATAHVVAETGYHGATIDAIKNAAGVSKKTFYVHFGSKEDAFLATYEIADLAFASMLDVADRDAPHIVATLDAVIAHYLDLLAAWPDLTRMLLIEALAASTRIQQARKHGLDIVTAGVRELIARAQASDPGIPSTADNHIWAMLAGVNEMCVRHITEHSVQTLPELRSDIATFMCRVLRLDDEPRAARELSS